MKINFGGVIENVITQKEFSLQKAHQIIGNDLIAVLGYGIQGQGQALNLRDNGFKVIIGQRKGTKSWQKAIKDGLKPVSLEEAVKKAQIIFYLLSDAGQKEIWPRIKPFLKKGKTLVFAHGFSITFQKQTKVTPPKNIDVILVAPKGPGIDVRRKGINASFAVYQDATGSAKKKALALAIGIGSTYIFETTFKKETYSDLVGERGTLVGAIAGLMEAQYNELRKRGHSPSEAFNDTVEEATRSLIPLINENGLPFLLENASTTAQRGALDWRHEFRKATEPTFKKLYDNVKSGKEARIVLEANSAADCEEKLEKEINKIKNSEMWKAGEATRKLRRKVR